MRIVVRDLSKRFRIGFKKGRGALERFVSVFSGVEQKREIWALRDVSFEVKKGEIVGIIGKNGSGKSTLLRIIAGIYSKTRGMVKTFGKVIPLVSLNLGFQPRLSMKDNIFLCCSLFGLGKRQIKKSFGSIVEFAELERFVNTKLYQFSDGMRQRLAFSIVIHSNPEILLLDEVFEMGDESFKRKSSKKIKELVRGGSSVLLVSHDLDMIKKYCKRVIHMEEGKIVKEGKSKEVLKSYLRKKC
jgi:ABC-type polysaccharide/polyol phosphate transport system ATPase subunit